MFSRPQNVSLEYDFRSSIPTERRPTESLWSLLLSLQPDTLVTQFLTTFLEKTPSFDKQKPPEWQAAPCSRKTWLSGKHDDAGLAP